MRLSAITFGFSIGLNGVFSHRMAARGTVRTPDLNPSPFPLRIALPGSREHSNAILAAHYRVHLYV